ncbi:MULTISPECIES: hypothetical protein [Streptomyces]|uniref:hypothetical protein n=1 Tax=Streptomyces TaxID=1883 RepID=UPI001F2D690D|nr:hypothetical protein [Streptomyces sp. A1-5]UJB45944.1 hypothetical protein HRD51_38905 [Streptomyces sp. A1-5]
MTDPEWWDDSAYEAELRRSRRVARFGWAAMVAIGVGTTALMALAACVVIVGFVMLAVGQDY